MIQFTLYIFLLLTFPTLQTYQESCECIIGQQSEDALSPYGLLPDLFNSNIEDMPNKPQIQRIVKVVYHIEKNKYRLILKSVLLSNFKDQMLKTMEKIDNRITENRLIKCQYDNQYVYIIKSYFTLSELCQELHETPADILSPQDINENLKLSIIEGRLTGNMGLFSKYFEIIKKNQKKGAFGTVKEFSVENGNPIIVKRIKLSQTNLLEIVVMKEFNKLNMGAQFYGCFYNDTTFYIAQEKPWMTLNERRFTRWYHNTITKTRRRIFILDMIKTVWVLEKINWTHNDIKPDNFMFNYNGKPQLIDFGFAAKIGGADFSGWTQLFASPFRIVAETALAKHDIYSLALTIVAIESPINKKVLSYKFGTHTRLPKRCHSRNRDNLCVEWMGEIIVGTLEPNWGEYESEQTDIANMNLTTLIMNIVIKFNQDLDIRTFYERVDTILNEFYELEEPGQDFSNSNGFMSTGLEEDESQQLII